MADSSPKETSIEILASDGQLAARVRVSDHLRATEVLTTAGFTVEPLPDRILKVSLVNHKLDLAVVTRLLADQGLYVSELTPIQPDLESVFLDLTAGQHLTARQERRHHPTRRPPQQRQRRPEQQQRRPERRRQPEAPGLGRAAVTRLIWAEVSRLLSRRLTGIAIIVMLLGLGGYQLVVNDALSPPSGEQLAAAERAYQQVHKDWVADHEQYEQECRDTGAPPDECVIP